MVEEETEREAPSEGCGSEQKPADTHDPIEAKEKQIRELTDDLRRLQADFDNFKKRVDRETGERYKLANERLIKDLLPILDSFDKALEDARNNGDPASLGAGLEELHKQLLRALQREGLREIMAAGSFDPFMHEAVMREEREDAEDGEILEVFQKGYAIGQKAIRPTKVKVAKRKGPEAPEESLAHDERTDQAHGKEDMNPTNGR